MFWFAMFTAYPMRQTTAVPSFNTPHISSLFSLFQAPHA